MRGWGISTSCGCNIWGSVGRRESDNLLIHEASKCMRVSGFFVGKPRPKLFIWSAHDFQWRWDAICWDCQKAKDIYYSFLLHLVEGSCIFFPCHAIIIQLLELQLIFLVFMSCFLNTQVSEDWAFIWRLKPLTKP